MSSPPPPWGAPGGAHAAPLSRPAPRVSPAMVTSWVLMVVALVAALASDIITRPYRPVFLGQPPCVPGCTSQQIDAAQDRADWVMFVALVLAVVGMVLNLVATPGRRTRHGLSLQRPWLTSIGAACITALLCLGVGTLALMLVFLSYVATVLVAAPLALYGAAHVAGLLHRRYWTRPRLNAFLLCFSVPLGLAVTFVVMTTVSTAADKDVVVESIGTLLGIVAGLLAVTLLHRGVIAIGTPAATQSVASPQPGGGPPGSYPYPEA
ncbi:hypothetical protein ACQCX5_11850 [Propionibacteriaceae bacterium G57]|uniref:hypothetical protein n=1 Tax=Aestuariimicrobium sp. G57 TaxID=3418485 RepID=UPI003DA72EB9